MKDRVVISKGKVRAGALTLAAGVAALTATRAASGNVIAYDPFNQGTTSNINGTASTSPGVWPSGNNWSSSGNVSIVSGNLGYTDSSTSQSLSTTGNTAQLNAESAAAFRGLGSTYGGAGSDFWVSFTLNAESTATSNANVGLSLFSGTSSEHIFIGVRNDKFGFADYAKAPGNVTQTSVAPDSNAHLIVMHFQLTTNGASTDTFYLDPTGLGTGTAPTGYAASVVSSSTNTFTFDTLRIGRFTTSATAQMDEIRLGDTWQDVSPVPEPASLGLLAGVAALGLRRRRSI